MFQYVIRRVIGMIPTLLVISLIAFTIMQLPPGDFISTWEADRMMAGEEVQPEAVAAMRDRYGLERPLHVQYLKWVEGIILRGDFGLSLQYERPVEQLIWNRLSLTFLISLSTLLFTWLISFPIGVYSAVYQYSIGDYIFTFIGFIGLAVPNFLFALILMYVAFKYFGESVGGLYSLEYVDAPWSLGKAWDLFKHMLIPMIVLGTSGTAALVRIMRANLLDELGKPYVTTARAKGVHERVLLLRYPVRVALNPFVSTVGWTLPQLVSGAAIVSVVLSLPTTGPMYLNALLNQDIYLAGAFVLLLSSLTVIGTLISDLLLAWLDPRIRYQ